MTNEKGVNDNNNDQLSFDFEVNKKLDDSIEISAPQNIVFLDGWQSKREKSVDSNSRAIAALRAYAAKLDW
ncbi:hypothetical protein TDB9533_00401 [Thalassocella blandensis]|nr:hypothetical protein TDB9533_00401 [Thalassocella blandensis]